MGVRVTCSRPSSSAIVLVSPLLFIGISIVAALLIMLSVIVQSVRKKEWRAVKQDSQMHEITKIFFKKTRLESSFSEYRPKTVVRPAKSLGRRENNYHK